MDTIQQSSHQPVLNSTTTSLALPTGAMLVSAYDLAREENVELSTAEVHLARENLVPLLLAQLILALTSDELLPLSSRR